MRICDAQASAEDSTTLAALITSCVAQAALDHDEGAPFEDPPPRLWRRTSGAPSATGWTAS